MKEIGIEADLPKLFNDNQSVLRNMWYSNSYRPSGRHVGVRYFLLRNAIQNGDLSVAYRPTADMIVDAHTKPLSRVKLEEFRRKLCVAELAQTL